MRKNTPSNDNHRNNNTKHVTTQQTTNHAHSTYIQKRRLETMSLRRPRRHNRCTPAHAQCGTSSKRSDSTNNDSQRSALTSESSEIHRLPLPGESFPAFLSEQTSSQTVMTEQELARRRNDEKCMSWIEKLPAKFSGMFIAQERAPTTQD